MAVAGPIQFDVVEKEVSGKKVREALIKSFVSQENVRVTIWDNYAAVEVAKGDILFADGKGSVNTVPQDDGTTKVYRNLSATKLAVIKAAIPVETAASVNTTAPAAASKTPVF